VVYKAVLFLSISLSVSEIFAVKVENCRKSHPSLDVEKFYKAPDVGFCC